MIKSIELKNIQSHEHTVLNFDEGVNCIVGSSNNGKSAIMRGLYYARYNRPLGIDTLASHWALDKKGNLKDEISVIVETDNGIVERKRTKTDNQYIVNDKVLNVVKSDVPEDVTAVLNLSETNIQKQLDEPFLLSQTSGEVAKYFNHVVRLDIIDKVLTNAETTRRKTNQQIQNLDESIKEQQEKLEEFEWLDKAGKLIHKCEVLETTFNEEIAESNLLNHDVIDFEVFDEKLSKLEIPSDVKKLIKDFETEEKELDINCSELEELEASLKYYSGFEKRIIDFSFADTKKIINDFIKLFDEEFNLDCECGELHSDLGFFERHEENIKRMTENIKVYKSKLPKICPVCGQPWDCCKEL